LLMLPGNYKHRARAAIKALKQEPRPQGRTAPGGESSLTFYGFLKKVYLESLRGHFHVGAQAIEPPGP
jgi:hypothetical protein